jgi:hypothetical protein
MSSNISVVVIGRNDGYGGNLDHRAIHCLNNLSNHYDEVIYVDWNSPKESLITSIKNSLNTKNKLKCYEVSDKDIALNNPEYSNYVIVESLARNIGVRRCSNDWILVTNIDILIERIDLSKYKEDTLYTAAKRCIPEEIHLKFSNTSELIKHIKTIKDNYPLAQDALVNGLPAWDEGDYWSLVVGCGDFQFAHFNAWDSIRGFEESLGGRTYADSNLMKKGYLYANIEKSFEDIYHLNHGSHRIVRLENEILPQNDRISSVNEFQKTLNASSWGWKDYSLSCSVI